MNTLHLPARTATAIQEAAGAYAESLLNERRERYLGELRGLSARMARWGCAAETKELRNEIALVQSMTLTEDANLVLNRLPRPSFGDLTRLRARFCDYVQLVLNNWPTESCPTPRKEPATKTNRRFSRHLFSPFFGKPPTLAILTGVR